MESKKGIPFKKSTLAATLVAGTVAGFASGTAHARSDLSFRPLGTAAEVRSTVLNEFQTTVGEKPLYLAHESGEKEGEGKCGEGKCGDDKKDGDKKPHDDKAPEGKCGEGKCGS